MKIGCGTDIIEISRIRQSIEQFGDVFIKKIFTQSEISYCEGKNIAKYQHYAARFAAKEAIYKAINNFEKIENADFLDAEIINGINGKPSIRFCNKLEYMNMYHADISISHCKEYAMAMVIIMGEDA